jgi:hypothetical protein
MGTDAISAPAQHDFTPMIYSILNDFSGPLATVIAAITAAYFVRRQWQTAQQQADTAKDQLRYSLFEKRYAIYVAARKAVALSFERRDEDQMPAELNALFLHFEEARFFFPDQIYLFLDQLRKDMTAFLQKNYLHRRKVAQQTDTQSADERKVLLDEAAALLTLQEQPYVTSQMLPKTFADVLAFPQLTGRAMRYPNSK